MVTGDKLRESLSKYVPADAVETVVDWIRTYRISVRIKNGRATRYGDYRSPRNGQGHLITINNDLNRYAFLLTFTHEVAHLTCFLKHNGYVLPHGEEWKREFRYLLKGFLDRKTFPDDLAAAIAKYMIDPAASSCTDVNLQKALRRYNDQSNDGWQHLEEIPHQSAFSLKNGKRFIKGEKLRKNYVCHELQTHHKYFMPPLIEVKILEGY